MHIDERREGWIRRAIKMYKKCTGGLPSIVGGVGIVNNENQLDGRLFVLEERYEYVVLVRRSLVVASISPQYAMCSQQQQHNNIIIISSFNATLNIYFVYFLRLAANQTTLSFLDEYLPCIFHVWSYYLLSST